MDIIYPRPHGHEKIYGGGKSVVISPKPTPCTITSLAALIAWAKGKTFIIPLISFKIKDIGVATVYKA
jgi:hypothetical protein